MGMSLCWRGEDVKNIEDLNSAAHTHIRSLLLPSLYPCLHPSLPPLHPVCPLPLNKLRHMLRDECPTNGSKRWMRTPYERCIVQPHPPSQPPTPWGRYSQGPIRQGQGGFGVERGGSGWVGGSCCHTRMLFIGLLGVSCCLLHSVSLPLILSWSNPPDGSADRPPPLSTLFLSWYAPCKSRGQGTDKVL